jgi:hypothetical protein
LDNGTVLLRLRSLYAMKAWITDFHPEEEGMEMSSEVSHAFL